MAENTEENSGASGPEDPVVAALRRILRPLARLLISRELLFPSVSALLRAAYVEVADREFPIEGKRQTDSRISLLTGVHRKDVKRLRRESQEAPRPPRAATLGSQLIARWTTEPEYLDDGGEPRPLPRLASAGEAHSFESLVRSVSTDIRSRAVLDEWLRLGIAEMDDQDRVRLKVHAFIPGQGSEEIAYYFGRNLHDHAAAAVHNLMGKPEPFLDRSVSYNNLSREAVAELTDLAQRRSMQVLQELNAHALGLQRRDSGQVGASNRFNLGIYLFTEDEDAEPDGNTEDENS